MIYTEHPNRRGSNLFGQFGVGEESTRKKVARNVKEERSRYVLMTIFYF